MKDYDRLKRQVDQLEKENQELKKRLNTAVEREEKNESVYMHDPGVQNTEENFLSPETDSLPDHLNDAVLFCDKNGNIQKINRSALHLLETSYDQAMGKKTSELFQLYHYMRANTPVNPLQEVLKTGKVHKMTIPVRLRNHSGNTRFVKGSFSPVYNENKNGNAEITGALLVFADTSETIQLEQRLFQAENLRSLVISQMKDMVIFFDQHLIVQWANQAVINEFNINPSDFSYKKCYALFHQRNEKCINCPVEKALTTGKTETKEINLYSGKILKEKATPVKTPKGKDDGIIMVISDITDEKREADLGIKNLETKLRSLLNASNEIFVLYDDQLNIIEFNKVADELAERFFGSQLKAGAHIFDFLPRTERFLKAFQKSIQGKRKKGEINLAKDTAKPVWYQYTLAPVYDFYGNLIGGFVNASDISQAKQNEEEMAHLLGKERELNELKSQFISTVSHEFRTPLANILLNIQLIEKLFIKEENEPISKNFKRIYNAAEYLVNMLNEISLISKDQSGKLVFAPTSNNVEEIMLDQIEQISSLQQPPNRIQWINNAPDLGPVLVDKNLFSHIVSNIISNALKYSDESNEVRCTLESDEDHFMVTVSDKGKGIPEEEQKHIFEQYYRASNVGKNKGTGLGLSVVKRCMDLHQGEIQIDSKQNAGTQVILRFPKEYARK